jgi:hypothetical protein
MIRSIVCVGLILTLLSTADAVQWEPIPALEHQPFVAATQRLIEALQLSGDPLSDAELAALTNAIQLADPQAAVLAIQRVLDARCLAQVTINPESRVSVIEGHAEKELIQQGWRTFLVKVHNQAGITAQLELSSPQAEPMFQRGTGARERPQSEQELLSPADSMQRFLDLQVYTSQPLKPTLSGLLVEYRMMQLFSRDAGMREATLAFSVGQGTQDLGFRNEIPLLFRCLPAVEVVLGSAT